MEQKAEECLWKEIRYKLITIVLVLIPFSASPHHVQFQKNFAINADNLHGMCHTSKM